MASNQNYIAALFQEKPWQWGLRGDPYLWQEMAVPLLLERYRDITKMP